jgi:hypothetical protein
MRSLLLVACVLAACADTSDPDMRVERQAATIADVKGSNWLEGGAVLVGAPGTFSFPQPLSVRISVVDSKQLDANGNPKQMQIRMASVATYGMDGELEILTQPTCTANYCTAELRVVAQGSSMLTLQAMGPGLETQDDCFYYGVYEDADPATVGAQHQMELEAQQADCRASFWN